jgi:hypothetical protein
LEVAAGGTAKRRRPDPRPTAARARYGERRRIRHTRTIPQIGAREMPDLRAPDLDRRMPQAAGDAGGRQQPAAIAGSARLA